MPIDREYQKCLMNDLREQGFDPESGLGREIMKLFQFTLELHERVKALEEKESDDGLSDIKKELQGIRGAVEQIVNTMPQRLILGNVSAVGSIPMPMRKALDTD